MTEANPAEATSPETTVARELIAGLIGTAVALGCLLPPLVHLVSGPLGPMIGGFVAARWVRPGERGRAIIAASVGGSLAAIGACAAAAIAAFGGPPSWFPPVETVALILIGVGLYGAAMSAVGVTLASSFGRGDAAAR